MPKDIQVHLQFSYLTQIYLLLFQVLVYLKKKLKLIAIHRDNKENENNVDITRMTVQEDLLLANQVFMQKNYFSY